MTVVHFFFFFFSFCLFWHEATAVQATLQECFKWRETILALGDNKDNLGLCTTFDDNRCGYHPEIDSFEVRHLCPPPPPQTSTLLATSSATSRCSIRIDQNTRGFQTYPSLGLEALTQGSTGLYYSVGRAADKEDESRLYVLDVVAEYATRNENNTVDAVKPNCSVRVVRECRIPKRRVEAVSRAPLDPETGDDHLFIAGVKVSNKIDTENNEKKNLTTTTPFISRINAGRCGVQNHNGTSLLQDFLMGGSIENNNNNSSNISTTSSSSLFFAGLSLEPLWQEELWAISQTSLYPGGSQKTRGNHQYFFTRFDVRTGRANAQFKYFAAFGTVLADVLALDDFGSFLIVERGEIPLNVTEDLVISKAPILAPVKATGHLVISNASSLPPTTSPPLGDISVSVTEDPVTSNARTLLPAATPTTSPRSKVAVNVTENPINSNGRILPHTASPTTNPESKFPANVTDNSVVWGAPTLAPTTSPPSRQSNMPVNATEKPVVSTAPTSPPTTSPPTPRRGTCLYRAYVQEIFFNEGVARKDLVQCVVGDFYEAAAYGLGHIFPDIDREEKKKKKKKRNKKKNGQQTRLRRRRLPRRQGVATTTTSAESASATTAKDESGSQHRILEHTIAVDDRECAASQDVHLLLLNQGSSQFVDVQDFSVVHQHFLTCKGCTYRLGDIIDNFQVTSPAVEDNSYIVAIDDKKENALEILKNFKPILDEASLQKVKTKCTTLGTRLTNFDKKVNNCRKNLGTCPATTGDISDWDGRSAKIQLCCRE